MSQNKIIIAATTWEKSELLWYLTSIIFFHPWNSFGLSIAVFYPGTFLEVNSPRVEITHPPPKKILFKMASMIVTVSPARTFYRPFRVERPSIGRFLGRWPPRLTVCSFVFALCVLRPTAGPAWNLHVIELSGARDRAKWVNQLSWSWDWVEKWLRVRVTRDNCVRDSSVKRFETVTVRRS